MICIYRHKYTCAQERERDPSTSLSTKRGSKLSSSKKQSGNNMICANIWQLTPPRFLADIKKLADFYAKPFL